MDYFPVETVEKARKIAGEYKLRWDSKREWISSLQKRAFLELSYGFDDAIRKGRCGHFLHQAERDSDCFSFAGIFYIVARELGLNPKLYDARDMRDVTYGENPLDKMVADHCFISVEMGGKEILLDSMMGIKGVMVQKEGRIIIKSNDGSLGEVITERTYSSLKQISEKEYVKIMQEHQSPNGGRITLACGQRVTCHNNAVMIQYLPDANALLSSVTWRVNPSIIDEHNARKEIYELLAPLRADGSWAVEEGKIRMFLVESAGWTHEQHVLPHRIISLDYKTVSCFLRNLETAARYHGRKGSMALLDPKDKLIYFEERGFSPLGQITAENGVDAKEHQLLLDEIVKTIPLNKEPGEVEADINQKAVYLAASLRSKSPSNPYRLVYPEEKRQSYIDDHLPDIRENLGELVDMWYNKILADGGLIQNMKSHNRQLQTRLTNREEVDKFRGYLENRRKNMPAFEERIDWALFQLEHPRGTVTATEEEKIQWYRYEAYTDMIDLLGILAALELKRFRPGLKRILAKT